MDFFSKLHYNDKLDHGLARLYRQWMDKSGGAQLLTNHIVEKCSSMGVDELVSRSRIYYDEDNKKIRYAYIDDMQTLDLNTSYDPSTFNHVNAVCGPDGAGKGFLLKLLKGKVAVPIAHLDDPKTMAFLLSHGMSQTSYDGALTAFKILRGRELKATFTLAAYKYVRSLFSQLDQQAGILTAFNGIIFDRSWLTNFAYISSPLHVQENFLEFLSPYHLNPERIIAVDTPVTVTYARSFIDRTTKDEFDKALFVIHVRRATFYKIFGKALPNVVSLKTYENGDVINPVELKRRLEELLTIY